MQALILLGLIALGVGFFFLSRRKRTPRIDPKAAWDAVQAGAPMTGDLAAGVGAYFAQNARPAFGVVEQAMSPDNYGVVLQDGRRIRATRGKGFWQRGIHFVPGQRVQLLMVPGDHHGTITAVEQ